MRAFCNAWMIKGLQAPSPCPGPSTVRSDWGESLCYILRVPTLSCHVSWHPLGLEIRDIGLKRIWIQILFSRL